MDGVFFIVSILAWFQKLQWGLKTDEAPQIHFLAIVSVSVSAQDDTVALGKVHTHSALPLSSLPKIVLETVPMFVWLNTDRSRPRRLDALVWPVQVQKVSQASVHLCPAKLQT